MEEHEEMERPSLTSLSTGSGCGCKIAPLELEQILSSISPKANASVLLDHKHSDDAAVIHWSGDEALIMTNDFFTPIVDDPFSFGRIAATNAINDVYAMGGSPIAALSILGWPVEQLGTESANAVLKGASSVCDQLNVALVGGHSIESKEPFFGLSVNGRVLKDAFIRNQGIQAGDLLYLTKPLGSGMMSSALKRGKLEQASIDALIEVLTIPNNAGEGLGALDMVHAMTDVTGFGLLGHALEMCSDDVGVRVAFDALPLIDPKGIKQLSDGFVVPNNTMRNFKAFHESCSKLNAFQLHVLCDPQTSGGLLIAVDPSKKEAFEAHMSEQKTIPTLIGEGVKREATKVPFELI
jgi:selenide,water dikinase